MDFGSVLQKAAARQGVAARPEGNFYKTKFEPPKKENKSKTLSSNIQKFLAKKEEEERQRSNDARRKRDELLAMRDPKATNKIKKMLKVIKSANKSVLDEAVDNVNTAVTMHGPDQPDEDDYGYVSQEASAFYSKMMERYKSVPDEEKFPSGKKKISHDLLSTKDRVRAAIMRQQEEDSLPHRRKRKSHNNTYEDENLDGNGDDSSRRKEKPEEKPKPKRSQAPPPVDFNELLKIAEKKQFEPIVVETKKVESNEESERPMTKRQKREFEEHKAYQEARLRREKDRAMASAGKKKDSFAHSSSQREDSLSKSSCLKKPETSSKSQNGLANMRIPKIGDRSNNNNSTNTKTINGENGRGEKNLIKKDDRNRESFSKGTKDAILPKPKLNNGGNLKMNQSSNVNSSRPSPSVSNSNRISKDTIDSQNRPSKISNAPQNTNRSLINSNQKTSLSLSKAKGQPPGNSSRPNPSINAKTPKGNFGNQKQITSQNERMKAGVSSQGLKDFKGKHLVGEKDTNKMNRVPAVGRLNLQDRKPSPSNENKLGRPYSQTPNKDARRLPVDMKKSRAFPPSDDREARQFPPPDVKGVRKFPPSDVKGVRQFPPSDVKGVRQFPPTDVKGVRQFPPSDMRKKKEKPILKRRILDDDDSEYDSSLDGFIDDGPEESNDVSKYIKEIFGYDKSRYRDVDEDVGNMESNYSQVMREEYISKKIGLLEDLEDMRMEALEKKQKSSKKRKISD